MRNNFGSRKAAEKNWDPVVLLPIALQAVDKY
jgi:hypothetical protein